jgi:hypothetical protein
VKSSRRNLSEWTFWPNWNLSEWNLSEGIFQNRLFGQTRIFQNGIIQKESFRNNFLSQPLDHKVRVCTHVEEEDILRRENSKVCKEREDGGTCDEIM